jgi:predicted DNA-binding protein
MSHGLKTTSISLDSELVRKLEDISTRYHESKNEILQEALQYYIEEKEDLDIAMKKLNDPSYEFIDWDTAKDELLRQD